MLNKKTAAFLITFDSAMVLVSLILGFILRGKPFLTLQFFETFVILWILTMLVSAFSLFYYLHTYINLSRMVIKGFLGLLLVYALYAVILFLFKYKFIEPSRLIIGIFMILYLVYFFVIRVSLVPLLLPKIFKPERLVLVAPKGIKYRKIIEFFDSRPFLMAKITQRVQNIEELKELDLRDTAGVILYSISTSFEDLLEEIKKLKLFGGKIYVYSPILKVYNHIPLWPVINNSPLIDFRSREPSSLYKFSEKLLNWVISLIGVIILIPLFIVVGLAIKLTSKGPILFKQKRLKSRNKEFLFLKFRTMYVNYDHKIHEEYVENLIKGKVRKGKVFKLRNDPRVTKIGSFLRKTSLDELPQFLNVLKGDMSVVGPRPPIPYEVEKYEEWHKMRLDCKQGITGMWQVFGRSRLPFDESVFLDIWYCMNKSIFLDLYLIINTIPSMLKGAY